MDEYALRYQQGPPPEVLMQLQGFNIQPACVLHGNFGETSALIPDLQGVGFTCTIFTQWPRECGANWLEILVELKETGQSFLQSPHLRGNLGSNSWQFVQGPGKSETTCAYLVEIHVVPLVQGFRRELRRKLETRAKIKNWSLQGIQVATRKRPEAFHSVWMQQQTGQGSLHPIFQAMAIPTMAHNVMFRA